MEKADIEINKYYAIIGILTLLLVIIIGRTFLYQGRPDSYFAPEKCKDGYNLKNNGSLCESDVMNFECTSNITCSKGCYICWLLIIKDEHKNVNISLNLFQSTSTKYLFKGKVQDSYIPCFSQVSKSSQAICDEVKRNAIVESVDNLE